MASHNTTKCGLNNDGYNVHLQGQITGNSTDSPTFQQEPVQQQHNAQGQVFQDEKEFLFQKTFREHQKQRKSLRIGEQITDYFPKMPTGYDHSKFGPWFHTLRFEDESGKVWFFLYKHWRGTGYHLHGNELHSYIKDKTLKEGDVLSFWRHRREEDYYFITIRRQPQAALDGGSAAPSSQHNSGDVTNELVRGKERKRRCSSEGQDPPERTITLSSPTFTGSHPHVSGPLVEVQHGSENMAKSDSHIDGQNLEAGENSFTPSCPVLTLPSKEIPVSVPTGADPNFAFLGQAPTYDALEEFLNFDDYEGLQNLLHSPSQGKQKKRRRLASTSKGQDQPESSMTLWSPSFTGSRPHVPGPLVEVQQLGSENMAKIVSHIDGQNLEAADNSFTPSCTVLPSSCKAFWVSSAPISESTSTMPHGTDDVTGADPTFASAGQAVTNEDFEEFFNFEIDHEGFQNHLHSPSQGDYTLDDLLPDHNVLIAPENISNRTVSWTELPNHNNPSNHGELVLAHDPELEAQLKPPNEEHYFSCFSPP